MYIHQSTEGVEYISQHGCIGEVGADTTETVYSHGSLEHALFRALDSVRGVDDPADTGGGGDVGEETTPAKEKYSELGRAPKFSRAARYVHQCVAVCCGVLQCVAVCCSVLQCVAVCCSVLQRGKI